MLSLPWRLKSKVLTCLGIQTDATGNVTESSVSCVGILEDNKLITPPVDLALASTTLVRTFAMIQKEELETDGISGYEQREMTADELANAKEMLSFGGG
jgi:branched-subunit amino acid aminotransferase/4-amino-4-deoxychorismate lyase